MHIDCVCNLSSWNVSYCQTAQLSRPIQTPQTHCSPLIMPMMSCDIIGVTRLHPLDISGLLFYFSNVKNFMCHCHSLRNFPHSHTSPHIHLWFFKAIQAIISWVWVIHRRLNVNWIKIHSKTLSVICHYWKNFPLLTQIPPYPFMNFQNPTSHYFLSLSHS